MQRVAFPELQGRPRPRRHRKQPQPDRVVLGLKIATFLAGVGLLGVIILLAGSGPDGPDRSAAPAPAQATGAPGPSGDDAYVPRQRQTTPATVIDPPAVRTDSSKVASKPTPTSKPPATTTSKPPAGAGMTGFATIGERCDEPGAFSFTSAFEPVVCMSDSPSDPPRWHPMF